MASRIARQVLSSTARASLRPARSNAQFNRIGRKCMSSSHGPEAKSSDKAWIIASSAIFGPALLYLLSPSARKSAHGAHGDAHGSSSHKAAEHEPVVMKDDEGTTADVAESIQQAETADVPKAAESPADTTEVTAAEPEPTESSSEEKEDATSAPEPPKEAEKAEPQTAPSDTDDSSESKQESAQETSKTDDGPTEVGEARADAVKSTEKQSEKQS